MDAAFVDSAHRSGAMLACRPGCTQCCLGAFAINALDAARLREGMQVLATGDQSRAAQVRERARTYVQAHAAEFPGDANTGVLGASEDAQTRFDEFANDAVCPALDPINGTCDLYEYRPLTCRVFGPPVVTEGGLGHCELCYTGASEELVKACEMHVPDELEAELLRDFDETKTIVAYCLL
jgi:Fe-S-cluster containining protein